VPPKASWAGLICRTCLHLKRQIQDVPGRLGRSLPCKDDHYNF